MLKIIMMLTLGLLSFNAQAFEGHDWNKRGEKTKSIIVTADKPTFSIRLKANRTTGYSWFLKHYNQRLIHAVSQTYKAPKTKRVGAGGETVFTFKVDPKAFKVQQLMTIKLIYAKPWDLSDKTKEKFTVVTMPQARTGN